MQQQERHNVVHRHSVAQLVDCTDAISVTIGRQAYQGIGFQHSLLESTEVLIDRLRIYSAKKWVSLRANGLNSSGSVSKKTLDPVTGGTVHRVDYDTHTGVPQTCE